MKFNKIIVSMLLACSLSTGLFAQEAAKMPDFGNVNFGDSLTAVKEAEKNTKLVFENDKNLVFEEVSEDTKSQNIYEFKDNKLDMAMINFVTEHKTLGGIVEEFKSFDEMLTKVYGEPEEKTVNVEDNSILEDNEKLAQAVKEGKASVSTVWKKENYSIYHTLMDSLPMDSLDEEEKKVVIVTPIAHVLMGATNVGDDEE